MSQVTKNAMTSGKKIIVVCIAQPCSTPQQNPKIFSSLPSPLAYDMTFWLRAPGGAPTNGVPQLAYRFRSCSAFFIPRHLRHPSLLWVQFHFQMPVETFVFLLCRLSPRLSPLTASLVLSSPAFLLDTTLRVSLSCEERVMWPRWSARALKMRRTARSFAGYALTNVKNAFRSPSSSSLMCPA
jgi:hypothetical protein